MEVYIRRLLSLLIKVSAAGYGEDVNQFVLSPREREKAKWLNRGVGA
jgi:hypothetical protein